MYSIKILNVLSICLGATAKDTQSGNCSQRPVVWKAITEPPKRAPSIRLWWLEQLPGTRGCTGHINISGVPAMNNPWQRTGSQDK